MDKTEAILDQMKALKTELFSLFDLTGSGIAATVLAHEDGRYWVKHQCCVLLHVEPPTVVNIERWLAEVVRLHINALDDGTHPLPINGEHAAVIHEYHGSRTLTLLPLSMRIDDPAIDAAIITGIEHLRAEAMRQQDVQRKELEGILGTLLTPQRQTPPGDLH